MKAILRVLRGVALGALATYGVVAAMGRLPSAGHQRWLLLAVGLLIVTQALIVVANLLTQRRRVEGPTLDPAAITVPTNGVIVPQWNTPEPSVGQGLRSTLVLTVIGALIGAGALYWILRDDLETTIPGGGFAWPEPSMTAEVVVPTPDPNTAPDGTPLSTDPVQGIVDATGSSRFITYRDFGDRVATEVVLPDAVHDVDWRSGQVTDKGPALIPGDPANAFDVSEVDWTVVNGVCPRAEELAGAPVDDCRVDVERSSGALKVTARIGLTSGDAARIDLDLAGQVTKVW